MPHSSGGGSHGGGSHGGGGSSHRSSHSSGGGHSGGGGASLSNTRVSNHRYRGCATYCYYENNKPHYIYSSYGAKKPAPAIEIVQRIILWLFIVVLMIGGLGGALIWVSFKTPKKISPPYKKEIIIDDRADLISSSEEDTLMDTLEVFYDKTGIVPAVVTVNNDYWIEGENKKDFTKVAYNEYLAMFKDEKHWLIMYSQPKEPDPDFNDWYWEGMQGDNTDNILTKDKTREFTDDLHKKFLQTKKYTVGGAINSAFEELNGYVMNTQINPVPLCFGIIILACCVPLTIYVLDIHPFKKAKLKKAFFVNTPGNSVPLEAQCDYCGGTYVIGAHLACPFCYAPITPHDLAVDASGNVTKILK